MASAAAALRHLHQQQERKEKKEKKEKDPNSFHGHVNYFKGRGMRFLRLAPPCAKEIPPTPDRFISCRVRYFPL